VKFAFAKATGGTSMDPQFQRNWQGIQEAGLFRGAYHYGLPGTDPETQAAFFASVVGPLGFRDLPPVLDLEQADGHPAAQVLEWARAFLEKAEALFGRPLFIYTGAFWRGPLGDPAPDGFFSERSLWLAGYVPESSLRLPKTWPRWTIWQYSDGTANGGQRTPGIGRCDQDWFEGDESQLDALCRNDAPAPPQPSAPIDQVWPGVEFVWPRTPAVAGDAVLAWQRKMVEFGFELDADGVYGPESKQVCLAFQRNRGLVPDGIVGRHTWNAAFATNS
jgi:peptidoglycan hydrolase-like protein with peptidoglycan-binding domain